MHRNWTSNFPWRTTNGSPQSENAYCRNPEKWGDNSGWGLQSKEIWTSKTCEFNRVKAHDSSNLCIMSTVF